MQCCYSNKVAFIQDSLLEKAVDDSNGPPWCHATFIVRLQKEMMWNTIDENEKSVKSIFEDYEAEKKVK